MMNLIKIKDYVFVVMIVVMMVFMGCQEEDVKIPESENEEEVITDVKLIFTNKEDGSDVVEVRAQDPDGEGVKELSILDEINLDVESTYTLTFEIMNNLDSPGEDIGDEISEEDDEHKIFFAFSDNAFSSPKGDGNIDDYQGNVNYLDKDKNDNPVGLLTEWTTSSTKLSKGKFTVRLQHQPDGIKTQNSSAEDGDTDFELEFVLNIK